MCKHNDEEDFDCLMCAYLVGMDDALEREPYKPEYKNFDQCDAYKDGYDQGVFLLNQTEVPTLRKFNES